MGNESMILHHRRVLTMQAQGAEDRQSELGGVYRKIRDTEVPGTPIPDDFPRRADLIAGGYAALEDLQDVTEAELAGRGLSRRATRAVLSALAELET